MDFVPLRPQAPPGCRNYCTYICSNVNLVDGTQLRISLPSCRNRDTKFCSAHRRHIYTTLCWWSTSILTFVFRWHQGKWQPEGARSPVDSLQMSSCDNATLHTTQVISLTRDKSHAVHIIFQVGLVDVEASFCCYVCRFSTKLLATDKSTRRPIVGRPLAMVNWNIVIMIDRLKQTALNLVMLNC